jgi:hypothetical protein
MCCIGTAIDDSVEEGEVQEEVNDKEDYLIHLLKNFNLIKYFYQIQKSVLMIKFYYQFITIISS